MVFIENRGLFGLHFKSNKYSPQPTKTDFPKKNCHKNAGSLARLGGKFPLYIRVILSDFFTIVLLQTNSIRKNGLSNFFDKYQCGHGIELGEFRFSFFYRLHNFLCMFPGILDEQPMSVHSAANYACNKNILCIGFVSSLIVNRLHYRIV